jgi:hypothetical protein
MGGEQMRVAMSAYLHTQVCAVHTAVVVAGASQHFALAHDPVNAKAGAVPPPRLVYTCLTQSEIVIVDKTHIGYVRNCNHMTHVLCAGARCMPLTIAVLAAFYVGGWGCGAAAGLGGHAGI